MRSRVFALAFAHACLVAAAAWAQSPFPPTYQLAWGSGGAGGGQFSQPWGVAWFQGTNQVYVTDQNNNRVQMFSAAGAFLGQWGTTGAGNGQFNRPLGIAINPTTGSVYVVDMMNNRVQQFNAGGAWMANIGVGQLNHPWGIAIDNVNGRIYVSDQGSNRIMIFNLAGGGFIAAVGGPGGGGGLFSNPRGVAFNPLSNRVYVADYGNNLVQFLNPGGGFMGQWGGGGSGNGQFLGPNGIACDAQSFVYVSDDGNQRVQKFSAGGPYVTQWGTAGAGNGQFTGPSGVSLDANAFVFVADLGNNRVQKFAPVFAIVSSSGSGGDIQPLGQVAVTYGNSKSFTITPDDCYVIADVLVDGSSVGAVTGYTFNNVTTNHTISATFSVISYSIGVMFSAGGSISPAGPIVSVPCGSSPAFTITPSACYKIGVVTVDGGSVGAVTSYTFTNVRTNHSITATFVNDTMTIAASAGVHGAISPSGTVKVVACTNPSFTITPDACYDIADVLVDGLSVGAVSTYTFTNVLATHTIEASFAHETPYIASVLDVKNDQGRQVRLRFYRSNADSAGAAAPVVQYEAYRRIDALPGGFASRAARARSLGMISTPGILLAGWDYVGAVPAHGEPEYNMIAPTLVDSNGVNGLRHSVFLIRAATAIPTTFYDSCADSGWSVDNLPPLTPAPFVMTFAAGETRLHWSPNLEADLAGYRIHRGSSADFVPGTANLASAQPDTGYGESQAAGYYYKLCAVDVNGNLSGYAMVTPLLGLPPGPLPAAVWLGRPAPNPSSGDVAFAFGLPRAAHLRLAIFDASGREVRRLLDGERAAGEHRATWDGRDAAGHACPSAVYYCRLEAEGNARVSRLVRIH